MKTIIKELKKFMFTSCEGRLYKSSGLSLTCGSPVYEQSLITSIDVDRIMNSGWIVLNINYPSKYTGRWETSSKWCQSVEEVKLVCDQHLGKSIRDFN